jgi:hypothetical protein
MDQYNPYQAPSAGAYGHAPQAMPGSEPITPMMIEHLRGAKPWIRFLSILSFVGAALMVMASLFMLIAGAAAMSASRSTGGPGAEFAPLLGLFYLPFAAIYLVPGIYMHRLANAIDQLVIIPSARSLEDTLDKNRAFWKVSGIMALVLIGLSMLVFFGAMIAGVVAAMR